MLTLLQRVLTGFHWQKLTLMLGQCPRISGGSQIFSIYKDCMHFLVCGWEIVPFCTLASHMYIFSHLLVELWVLQDLKYHLCTSIEALLSYSLAERTCQMSDTRRIHSCTKVRGSREEGTISLIWHWLTVPKSHLGWFLLVRPKPLVFSPACLHPVLK